MSGGGAFAQQVNLWIGEPLAAGRLKVQDCSAHARLGSLRWLLLGSRLAAILYWGFIVRAGPGGLVSLPPGGGGGITSGPPRNLAILQARATHTFWEVVKGRELDPEAPPRQQQPWRTRCPRLCESEATMRGGGMVVAPEGGLGPSLLPEPMCPPWTPRLPRPPLLSAHLTAEGPTPPPPSRAVRGRTRRRAWGAQPPERSPSLRTTAWPPASPPAPARSGPEGRVFHSNLSSERGEPAFCPTLPVSLFPPPLLPQPPLVFTANCLSSLIFLLKLFLPPSSPSLILLRLLVLVFSELNFILRNCLLEKQPNGFSFDLSLDSLP